MYVWYGCGSSTPEQIAAVIYARGLAPKGIHVVELEEGKSDDLEIFWMMLGDDDYARADYWKWRRLAGGSNPRIWRIDCKNTSDTVISAIRRKPVIV